MNEPAARRARRQKSIEHFRIEFMMEPSRAYEEEMENGRNDLRIDRLRGYFAVLVMVGHAMDAAHLSNQPTPALADMGGTLLGPVRGYFGFLWVIGFIVISGYCIARSCSQQGERFTLTGYGVMRVTRIYPLLFFCALFALCVEFLTVGTSFRPEIWSASIDTKSFIFTAVGLGWFVGSFGSLAPSYTITYELIYYFVWGLVWMPLWRRPVAALGLAISIWLLLYVIGWKFIQLPALIFICWLIGAAVWILRDWLTAPASRIPIAIAWLVLVVLATSIAISQSSYTVHPPFQDVSIGAVIKYMLLASAFGFIILAYASKPSNEDQQKFDRLLGELSYPLFLVHGPAIIFIASAITYSGIRISYSICLIVLCVASILLAYALVVTVERPVMAWRKVIAHRRLLIQHPAALPAE